MMKMTRAGTPAVSIFPAKNEARLLDFAYFSFVIGMTFQVSDVQITSRRPAPDGAFPRHSLFRLQHLILALAINIVSSML